MKGLKGLAQEAYFIYIISALISLIFSFWLSYREVVVNSDAICYLMSAREIGITGLKEAIQICPQAKWPFFSILIYLFSTVTTISHLVSANILDALFTMISVVTFIAIVRKMGGSIKVMWFAAFTILFAHEFNSVRQYIIRDHGYWAFYLLSIYFMIDYYAKSSWRNVTAWIVSLAIATLFRIEGVIFLALAPLFVFFSKIEIRKHDKQACLENVKHQAALMLKIYSPLLLLGLFLILALIIKGDVSHISWGRFAEVYQQLSAGVQSMAARFDSSTQAMIKYVLPHEAARDASLLWLLAMMISYLVEIVQNVFWVCALLIAYAWSKSLVPFRHPVAKILVAYIIINIIITASFYAQHVFLSKRYLIALSLLLWLWVPFALAEIARVAKTEYSRLLLYLAILLMISSSVGVFVNAGPKKGYIRTAANWVASDMPAGSRFYTNDYQLLYYSNYAGRDFYQFYKRYASLNYALNHLNEFDYIAVKIGRHDRETENLVKTKHLNKIKAFANKRGDRLLVYKVA